MVESEFTRCIERLKAVHPFTKKWNATREQEYFFAFEKQDYGNFNTAISRSIEIHKFFPSIAELRTWLPNHRAGASDREEGQTDNDCEACHKGFIQIEAQLHDQTYERVVACTCEAGQARQEAGYGKRKIKKITDIDPSRENQGTGGYQPPRDLPF